MVFDHQKVYIEKEGEEQGELLILTVDGKKYLGFNVNDEVDLEYIDIELQDLATLNLGSGEDHNIYLHNGKSTINADGSTTSSQGYYAWDNTANEFKSIVQW